MRVTFSMSYQSTLTNITKNQADMSKLTDMLSTGDRMSAPKDDPLAWAQAMDLKQGLREISTFQSNVEFATGWNEATYSALTQLDDVLTQVTSVGISAQSSQSTDEVSAQISTLEELIEQALGIANTQYDDSYVFSGTSLSTAAFDETTYGYLGNTKDFQVRIGANNLDTINLNGESVFFEDATDPTTNILNQITALKTAIENGDTEEIKNQTAALQDAQERVNGKSSLVGARLSSLESRLSALEDLEVDAQTDLSNIADADVVEVATMLEQKVILLEAALTATSKIASLNLTDYL